jgi:putative transposase
LTLGWEGDTAMEEITVIGPAASSNGSPGTTLGSAPARVCWNTLEQFARQQVQQFIQRLLEEEVTELLGRGKSERRTVAVPAEPVAEPVALPSEPPPGYRNGYGKPRRLTTGSGTVEVRRPRVRGLAERFESRILPLFQRRTPTVSALLPELYLHGLSAGDFDLALRGLLGEQAPVSASTVARLKAVWQTEYDAWKERSLAGQEVVYLWVDGIYVKAGLEKEKAALLVVIGAMRDGSKQVLWVQAGHRESTEAWSAILRELKQRGLNSPQLVIGDGALGIWGALANVFPGAAEQRCWNHRLVNVLDRLPRTFQPEAKERLRKMMYAETREQAAAEKRRFQAWTEQKGCGAAGRLLDEDWERLVCYYDFPKDHWRHLRTTNPVESPFAAVRLRTTAAKRYKKV